ncbi:MAG: hypothetical protein ACTSWW_07495 [Promethearchaeota archaeon]
MADKSKKPRKSIKAIFNRNRKKEIDTLADLEFENRTSPHIDESDNRYTAILEDRKKVKRLLKEEKLKKIHIGKKKHIGKRAVAEAEEQQA